MIEAYRRLAQVTVAASAICGLTALMMGFASGVGIILTCLSVASLTQRSRSPQLFSFLRYLFSFSAIAVAVIYAREISPLSVGCVVALNLCLISVRVSPLLIVLALIASHLVAFGYLFGEQGIYLLGTGIGMSMPIALGVGFLCYGALAVHPRGQSYLFFLGDSLGALTSRRLLPFLIVAPLAVGVLLKLTLSWGLFNQEFALAFLVLSLIVATVMILAFYSQSLDSLDNKRREILDHMQSMMLNLRTSEERYRILTEVSPLIVWEARADGGLSYANQHWVDYCGRPLSESLDDGWTKFVREDERERVVNIWRESVRTARNYDTEIPLRRGADGEHRYHLARGLPIFGPSGKVEKWVGIALDIHERTRTSEELRQALQVRDAFLSMASHELKTPLTSLRLQCQFLIQLLRSGDANAFARDRVEFMADQTNQQVGRLIRLVNDMLDVARIRTGRLSILRERFDIGELVSDCVSRLAPQAEVIRKSSAVGNWDRVRIDQVLSNLLSNAVKYGGGNRITVQIEDTENCVRVAVQDRGKGISAEDQDRIFGRFQRLSDTDGISGLGLGLFISRQIVLAHGGNLWVESSVGEGSTFKFELPLKDVSNPVENIDVSGSVLSQPESPSQPGGITL